MCSEPQWVVFAVAALAAGVASQVNLPEAHAAALGALVPGGVVERQVVALDEKEHAALVEATGERDVPHTHFVYIVRLDGAVDCLAVFDTHRVRTLRETLLVAFDPELRLRRVDVVAFAEPRRYLPRASYYREWEGRDAAAGRVDGVSGATLTSQATARAACRALALGALLRERVAGWSARVDAGVRAAAASAAVAAVARLRERFPDAEVVRSTRQPLSPPAPGDWLATFEVVQAGRRIRACAHTACAGERAASVLVVADRGTVTHEPILGESTPAQRAAAVTAARVEWDLPER